MISLLLPLFHPIWFCNVLQVSEPMSCQILAVRLNEARIAAMHAEADEVQQRTRAARLTKWMELMKQAAQDLSLPANAPEKVECPAYFQGLS